MLYSYSIHKKKRIEFVILDFNEALVKSKAVYVFTFSKKKINKTLNFGTKRDEIRSFFGEKLMELGLL